jgi:hypothetical protein
LRLESRLLEQELKLMFPESQFDLESSGASDE